MKELNPDASIVDAIASQQMGVDPEQVAATPDAATGIAQTPSDATASPESPAGKAAEQLSPVTEDDRANADPVVFKVNINGQEREFTDAQIRGTYERYTHLNQAHADMKDWIDYGRAMKAAAAQNGKEINYADLASETHNVLSRAVQHNPQMGKGAQDSAPDVPQDVAQSLDQWEQDNAVELPPGYKEAGARVSSVERAVAELANVVGQIAQGQQGVTGAAEAVQHEAKQEVANATKQRIATNIDNAQAKFGIQDEEEPQFMAFMQTRGYTPEDFISRELTEQVMQDYTNAKNSPEFARLQGLAAKRQAFTGTVDGAPSGEAGGTPKPAPDQAIFDEMTEMGLKRFGPQA